MGASEIAARLTILSIAVIEPLARHLESVQRQHDHDLARGFGRARRVAARARPPILDTTIGPWQELFGHADVSTTMVDTHVLNRGPFGVGSPVDRL